MRYLVLVVLVLAGCSTPYQDKGFTGGVSAEQITTDTFRISGRGNSFTSSTRIQDYVMLKAAETTVQQGGTHFLIIEKTDASRTSQYVTGGNAYTTYSGNTATTNYNPPVVQSYFKPGEDAYIRVIKVNAGENPPAGANSAAEIIQFVGSRVKGQ